MNKAFSHFQFRRCSAVLCLSALLTFPALSDSNATISAPETILTHEFFQEASKWQVGESIEVLEQGLRLAETGTGSLIVTPEPVKTELEDTSSHIMSKDYYGDKILKLEFLLSPNSKADVLLMGRYPVRLSQGSASESQLSGTGDIPAFWNEWNEDNPNRSYGGSPAKQALTLDANTWHQLHARIRAPRYDAGHNKVDNAFILSVHINGELVQENVIADNPAQNATFHWEAVNGPLVFDALQGQAAFRNVTVARADYSNIRLPENSGQSTNEAELVNFVDVGARAFKNYGCAECHSVVANDPSVKTGPNLYGLFTRDPRKRGVQNQEQHEYEVRADRNYLSRSIRNAEAELALVEAGDKAGEAYLPIMPRYTEQVIPDKDISAMYSFLLTRNDIWQQGPVVQLESAEGPQEYDPMADPMQFLVQDRIRIQRGPMSEVSGRAIHVGQPSGLHYSFDPRTLSVSKIWQGGFLETSGELNGRGGNGFEIGYKAIETNLGSFEGLIRPLNNKGNIIDFSFKSPKFEDIETIKASAYSQQSFEARVQAQDAQFKGYFRDSTQPLAPVSFYYSVGDNEIGVTHQLSPDGELSINISGELSEPQVFALNSDIIKDLRLTGAKLDGDKISIDTLGEFSVNISGRFNTVETPWTPPLIDFAYEVQDFEKGEASADLPPGYSIESWYAPKDNANRQQLFEAIGLDSTEDGQILVSTRTAGVWRLKDDKWHLFAEGIFDSLGLLSESKDGSVAVVGNKAELTRIKDINGDGIADHFETLFDDFTNASDYHAYIHGPTRDAKGNYVLTLNLANGKSSIYNAGGNVMGTHGGYPGWAVRVAPNGEHEYFANGLRSPAGLGTDMEGNVWYADNQGDFVGSSKIFMLEEGKFYGHPAGLIDEPGMTPDSEGVTWEAIIERKEKAPIVVAHGKVANSLGNPVWDSTEGKFGPFAGQMIIGDQTQSNLSRVIVEEVDGQLQGAMLPFAKGMESGIMRPIFLSDGSLLLGQTGRGWQAKGGNPAALQRITYDGKSIPLHIKHISISNRGFILDFTQALPASLVSDKKGLIEALSVSSWTYRDAPAYGSEEMGSEDNTIASVQLNDTATQLEIVLESADIPEVHPQQTAHVFHIKIEDDSLPALSGQASLDAFYSAHHFREP